MPNRKLATTRSSPQLVPSAPALNQIHEEAEEGVSPASSLSAKESVDPLDQFPSTPAGAVVTKRLEQRRRLRLMKARTTSCSSSDASDDDSESRRKREQEISSKTPSPPPRMVKDRQNDDSSDSQDPGITGSGGSSAVNVSTATTTTATNEGLGDGENSNHENSTSGRENSQASGTKVASNHRHRHHIRVRQSHSLNRISELHAEDSLLGCDGDDSPRQAAEKSGGRLNGLQRQLSSESDSDGTSCDMLSRYLESLSANNNRTRSRDDSLNSSDGEFEAGMSGHEQPRPPRRHKINLISLEQRLNKIQVS